MILSPRHEAVDRNRNHLYYQWFWWCPGCDAAHIFTDGWQFNGDYEKPTISPSILTSASIPGERCHVFITNGMIQFLGDCEHKLAGQTVPMVQLPDWLAREN